MFQSTIKHNLAQVNDAICVNTEQSYLCREALEVLDSNGIIIICGFFQDKTKAAGLWKGSVVGHGHSSPTQFPKYCHPHGPAGVSLSVKHSTCHTALVTIPGARGNDTALPSSGAWLGLLMGLTK